MTAKESNGKGEALNASVTTTPPDAVLREFALRQAESMDPGPARDRMLEIANSFITPAEQLRILADESDAAVESIKDKIKGMQETMAARAEEAKAYRAQADELEAGE